jgi:hypothetical protein
MDISLRSVPFSAIVTMLFHFQQLIMFSLAWRLATLMRFSVVVHKPSRQMPGHSLKLGNDWFLPYPFQFINHPII